jgi:hypothetical protein
MSKFEHRFKVGDKVRAIRGDAQLKVGDIRTVKELKPYESFHRTTVIRVKEGSLYYEDYFELVEPTPTWVLVDHWDIKRGDRIRAYNKSNDDVAEFTVTDLNGYVTSAHNSFAIPTHKFERLTVPEDEAKVKLRKQLDKARAKVNELSKILDET